MLSEARLRPVRYTTHHAASEGAQLAFDGFLASRARRGRMALGFFSNLGERVPSGVEARCRSTPPPVESGTAPRMNDPITARKRTWVLQKSEIRPSMSAYRREPDFRDKPDECPAVTRSRREPF